MDTKDQRALKAHKVACPVSGRQQVDSEALLSKVVTTRSGQDFTFRRRTCIFKDAQMNTALGLSIILLILPPRVGREK